MKRTVFYARVSTIHDNQLHSLNEQRKYFKNYIHQRDDLEYSGEYYDEGVSGTSLDKRTGFNKMMKDVHNHKFDLILVKDISRFSRNTLDTIEQVRLLKSHGIDVVFVNDHIDTSSSDGELSLTILATMAQEESRKISNRVKWTMTNEMKKGKMYIEHIYGYDVVDGELVVNEKEAQVVRDIFKWYLDGLGLNLISKKLKEMNIKTSRNKDTWALNVISYILANEKYIGDLATHKVSVDDYLTHKASKVDKDEQYYFYNHHEPIIDRETFNKAQKEKKRRRKKQKDKKYNFLSGKLECGFCYGYMRKESGQRKNLYYTCYNHSVFKHCSNNHTLNADVLKNMLRTVLGDFFYDKDTVQSKVIKAIKKSSTYSSFHKEQVYYEKRLKTISNSKNEILQKLLENKINVEDYQKKIHDYEKETEQINIRLEILSKQNQKDNYLKSINGITNIVKKKLEDDLFLESIISQFIDKIVFRNRNDFDLYINTSQYKTKEFDKNLYRYIVNLNYDFSYLESKYSRYKNYSDTNIGLYVMEV